jgi:hypothetical protein
LCFVRVGGVFGVNGGYSLFATKAQTPQRIKKDIIVFAGVRLVFALHPAKFA